MPTTLIKSANRPGRSPVPVNAKERLQHAKADVLASLESIEAQHTLSALERSLKTKLKECQSTEEFLLLRSDAASLISRHQGEREIQRFVSFTTKRKKIKQTPWSQLVWARMAMVMAAICAAIFVMGATHTHDLEETIQSEHMAIVPHSH